MKFIVKTKVISIDEFTKKLQLEEPSHIESISLTSYLLASRGEVKQVEIKYITVDKNE